MEDKGRMNEDKWWGEVTGREETETRVSCEHMENWGLGDGFLQKVV